MNYSVIKNCDIANGPGCRVVLFVSGCTHHCPGCFQPETWSFSYGQPFTNETVAELLRLLAPGYIAGLTLLGGEPFEPENLPAVLALLRRVRAELPRKTVWAFSGYTYDQLTARTGEAGKLTSAVLDLVDVLVDGEFVQELYSVALAFRGSENQRIIDVKKSLETGEIVWHALMSRGISMKFN